ncbi:LysR family transcriptional regulator [Demequina pelophila]|uniref:LysR family transcriptional regulator n=1 Tax=Demequina pelophila TaxID=1638984 RepID=UPI00078293C9|nr:LysR family transcriptional regulator [Demequina pelophila]
MLDLTRLATLREFGMRGTVAATAQALGYSPSAVSQQLAALEREAGVPLTARSGRGLVLTPAGQRLVARAHDLLATMELAQDELTSAGGKPSGTVRVAVFQSALLTLLPAALDELRTAHPRLRVLAVQSEPAAALADAWARDSDLVVAEEYPHHSAPHHPGIVRRPLLRDRLLLAVAPGAAASSLPALSQAQWIMEPAGTASRHFAEQACRTAGFEPDVRFETPDLQAHVAMIRGGLAVGFLPSLMADLAGPDLSTLPLPGDPHRTVFTATRESSRLDPAVAAVRDALERTASGR